MRQFKLLFVSKNFNMVKKTKNKISNFNFININYTKFFRNIFILSYRKKLN